MRVPGVGTAGVPRLLHRDGPSLHPRPPQPHPPYQDRPGERRPALHRGPPAPRCRALQGPPPSQSGRGKQPCLHHIQVM